MLTTGPTQQPTATTALPPPATNESFCTWLYDRINHIFQTILSWLCCCHSRNDATTSIATRDTTPHSPPNSLPVTNTRRTAPHVSPTISDPEPAPMPSYQPPPPPLSTTSTTLTASALAPTVPTPTTPAPIVTTPVVTPSPHTTAVSRPTATETTEPPQNHSEPTSPAAPTAAQTTPSTSQPQVNPRSATATPVSQPQVNPRSATATPVDPIEVARALCVREGYQHIVVPEARLYGNFVATKLHSPDNMHHMKEQIGLYMEHRDQFTTVAKEFAAMLYKASLDSHALWSRTSDYFVSLIPGASTDDSPVTLYLEGGIGKLGFLCLSSFKLRSNHDPYSNYNAYEACRCVIHYFPFHFDEILETVTQAGEKITAQDRGHLTQFCNEEQLRFNRIYSRHAAFLRENNVTLANPLALPVVTPQRKTTILNKIMASSYMTPIRSQPAEAIARFQEQLPEIWNIALNFISQLLNAQRAPGPTLPENLRFIKMVSCRSCQFYGFGNRSPYLVAINAIKEKFRMFQFTDNEGDWVTHTLSQDFLNLILDELTCDHGLIHNGYHYLLC